ncbi:hypothetical protein PMAYCL1PPCAC_03725, partial [Pristionchus mayeri]
ISIFVVSSVICCRHADDDVIGLRRALLIALRKLLLASFSSSQNHGDYDANDLNSAADDGNERPGNHSRIYARAP